MLVYRIAKKQYLKDLSGYGAKQFGGRWNGIGTQMLYTSSSISLATLEILCHVPMQIMPSNYGIITIEIPDDISIKNLNIKELPINWNTYPAPIKLSKIGNDWIKQNSSLLLKVPSVIVENEYNYLINPLHQDFNKIKIISESNFDLDKRIIKNI